MCHTYIYPVVPSLNWIEQTPRRLHLNNQCSVLEWKGNVWGKGLEKNGWRHVRSGRRLMWSSCSFCSPSNTDTRNELDQTQLSELRLGFDGEQGTIRSTPCSWQCSFEFWKNCRHRLHQWLLKLFFFPWPTTLSTGCCMSLGLLNPLTLIAHSCDLEFGNHWLGQT